MSLVNFGVGRHLASVAVGFRVAAVVTGVPTLAFAAFDAYDAYVMFEAPPGDVPQTYDDRGGLISLIADAANAAGGNLHITAGAAAWLFTALASAATLVVAGCAAAYAIGDALGRRARWGRVLGGIIAAGVAVASAAVIVFVAAQPRLDLTPAVVALVPEAASAYALWVLARRFD